MKTRWKTLSGDVIEDLGRFVADASAHGQMVHIGTDSLQSGRWTQFVTVVVIHTPGKGGRAAYTREVVPRMATLRERLLKEVWRSVELALQMAPQMKGELTVHIDANPSEKFLSNRYLQELVGMVMGQGFRVLIKPDAFAASHIADHIVRTKGKLPRGVSRSVLKTEVA